MKMVKKLTNDDYANAILGAMDSIEIGSGVGGIDYVVETVKETLPETNKQTLLDIIGRPDGLYDRGLVAGKVSPGNDVHISDVFNLKLTQAGHLFVKDLHSAAPSNAFSTSVSRAVWPLVQLSTN
jgi:hypothetical protein